MQSLLFLTEDGDSHRRSGAYGLALKRYHAVQKVFNEVEDDQYDFHGYSLRRFTLNIYMKYALVFLPSLATQRTLQLDTMGRSLAFASSLCSVCYSCVTGDY